MKLAQLSLCLLLGLLTSCSSVRLLTFDQLTPAQVSYPVQVKNIAVVNNMPPVPEAKRNVVTLGDIGADGKISAEALATALADSKYFNQVMICDSVLYSSEQEAKGVYTLPMSSVDQLLADLDADMLFSYDRLFIQAQKEKVYYPDMPVGWDVVKVKIAPLVSLYVAHKDKPVQVVSKSDSLFFEIDPRLDDSEIRKEAALVAAGLLAKHFTPYWASAERFYFDGGNSYMRDAGVCVRENDWEGAQKIWEKLFNRSKSDKVKVRTAFNLALACEMTGDFDGANRWMEEAKKHLNPNSQDKTTVDVYAVQLSKRIAEMPYLNMQMSRFNNNFQE
ncbi:DUF6340 family protein [uncultured Bacteroides sp.]|uniref:DUF6340 family protein n=1 Tax=uncultured Bacteroides sp. TaxID=162156 RepID=UPI00262EC486|nr:DUF6340 family protein [uncultured Bacteroides sp.]